MSHYTLKNLSAKWLKEVNHYASSAPKILVGTKLDLYDNLSRSKSKLVVSNTGDRPVKQKEIEAVMRSRSFLDYVPCSSISQVRLLKIRKLKLTLISVTLLFQSNLRKMFESAIT